MLAPGSEGRNAFGQTYVTGITQTALDPGSSKTYWQWACRSTRKDAPIAEKLTAQARPPSARLAGWMRSICGGLVTVLQATYAQCARMDARPHEKTFQTWTERIGIHGQERARTALQPAGTPQTFLHGTLGCPQSRASASS